MIRYCARCVMPETKPDLFIDAQGVCSACRNFEKRGQVDWKKRREELMQILDRHRSQSNYDCIVPVSGGKDSLAQTVTMLELGLKPLCVTATTDKLSVLGRRNIENLKNLGVDYVEITVNPLMRRRINRLALRQVGDISWPEHVAIFTIPVRMAVQWNIPLLIWGENSQNEYGGPAAATENQTLTRRWLEEFGGLLGLRVSDLIGQEGITAKDLTQLTYPSDDALKRVGVTGLFLGHFIPWDGYANAEIAKKHGFEAYHKFVEGSIVDYENVDNCQTGIHDYFKFLKFAFGRATDQACLHVRRGRLTRAEALKLVREHDGKFPWEYLGCKLEEILEDIGMTLEEFIKICDSFTNKKLFLCDSNNRLIKTDRGDLTKINYDNA